ncbi:hypothetical protein [Microbacterium sulfonylureivorans]|uniref:hypothetical protein n=1 Tax=Microbacterium sulfonylureivorans TaxID=2486854 RepID=UPI000FDA0525|nr:hypothetical protein [Microbacterium sulfonylureivorans]
MNDHERGEHDGLDRLISQSAPVRTVITTEIEEEFLRIARATGPALGTRKMPRRWALAGIGVSAAVILGTVGAAAAVTFDDWAWWAQEPDGVYLFTSPTGDTCEIRVGRIESDDPQIERALRDAQGQDQVLAKSDIAAAVESERRLHEDFYKQQRADGIEPYVQPDSVLYEIAINRVAHDYALERLTDSGIDQAALQKAGFSASSQINCSTDDSE